MHRQRLPPTHVTIHREIPVTTPIRTLLDLAAVLSLGALAKAFEQAQVILHIPPAPLAAEVISRPRQRGNAKLRRILAGAVDPADVRSVLELRSLRLCSSYWPDQTLVVETDGYEFHRTAAARRRDAAKDVTERPADTAALLGGTSVT